MRFNVPLHNHLYDVWPNPFAWLPRCGQDYRRAQSWEWPQVPHRTLEGSKLQTNPNAAQLRNLKQNFFNQDEGWSWSGNRILPSNRVVHGHCLSCFCSFVLASVESTIHVEQQHEASIRKTWLNTEWECLPQTAGALKESLRFYQELYGQHGVTTSNSGATDVEPKFVKHDGPII